MESLNRQLESCELSTSEESIEDCSDRGSPDGFGGTRLKPRGHESTTTGEENRDDVKMRKIKREKITFYAELVCSRAFETFLIFSLRRTNQKMEKNCEMINKRPQQQPQRQQQHKEQQQQ